MIKPDFGRLNRVLSSTTIASNSDVCWREFLVVNNNFVDYCSVKVKEDEIADLLKSLQNWTTKRTLKEYREYDAATKKWIEVNLQLGDIVYVDFGINFVNEVSYPHPAVVIEHIKESILVVPCSSNQEKINESYHPIDNKESKSLYRKVTRQDGFDGVCVLELDKVSLINKARVIKVQGHLNEDINVESSLFNEIKMKIFKEYLPKQYITYIKMIEENKMLKGTILGLEEELKKFLK